LLLSQCLRLERKLRRPDVDVQCWVWSALWHVFEYYDDYPEAAESLREIAAFLNQD
jgi:monoterpene epsilon-lactone hydrolase